MLYEYYKLCYQQRVYFLLKAAAGVLSVLFFFFKQKTAYEI